MRVHPQPHLSSKICTPSNPKAIMLIKESTLGIIKKEYKFWPYQLYTPATKALHRAFFSRPHKIKVRCKLSHNFKQNSYVFYWATWLEGVGSQLSKVAWPKSTTKSLHQTESHLRNWRDLKLDKNSHQTSDPRAIRLGSCPGGAFNGKLTWGRKLCAPEAFSAQYPGPLWTW